MTVPHSLEAEQSVLGGIMLDTGSDRCQKAMAMLKPESFYLRSHQVIFAEMRELVAKQQPVDLITLTESLEAKDLAETAGGFAYMAELSKNTPSAANIVHYAMVVREKAMERYGIDMTTKATELLYARNGMSTADKFEAIQSLFTEISDYARTGKKTGLRSFHDAVADWTEEFDERCKPNGRSRGLSSGLPSLDDLLGVKRIVRGSLFVIGARPKMGKTTLYTQMAVNCATVENEPALMFSLEMPEGQMVEKITAQQSRLTPNLFYPDMTKEDFGYRGDWDADLRKATGVMSALIDTNNLMIDDTPGIGLSHIVAEARRIKRERGKVGMVLVDYLTLMTADKAERNDLAYGLITKGLKMLAKELDCVVVLLTQLNRDLEKRTNKRPLPSDSRDTGQIEQDCDYWLAIYREGAYDETANQSETELLLRLNRHGETGVVYCQQRHGAIYDCDQEAASQRRREKEAKPAQRGGF
ncbi:TPA: DnaB-like helicase C-terminal domain-containing protein [Enterobacter hormaechei subsp. steigerwaltii]|uniref:DnaB-like helicase C-terminal domain-containing protein n=1 Tax=Enterobacter hormaechei TaxID=158836 RepID=UPI00137134D8|nr:DnaB-like helicase C-terminal domain-containing protein [Enterobacter hormaechei]EKS6393951.1 AAA family ATPase [Enterobacter hormaechei]EKY3891011.1 AAA family ATPase [Enterobacter hormaechei]EKY3938189.1 AAA family ATPase [Enterobacter hormaechei]EKY4149092.1 AAA family ATPase [Enterobacter hormaechei subsp. steigerwaltii]MBG0526697.1 AAA family ATPase [Enterobacter hormaechei]